MERAHAGGPLCLPLPPRPLFDQTGMSCPLPTPLHCSLAYLHHLMKAHEPVAATLLAIHNVHHMNAQASRAPPIKPRCSM